MKNSLLLGLTLTLLMVSPSLAKGQGVMTQTQDPETHNETVKPQGNEVKNQVKTQNAGEESQLMVNTNESLQASENATGSTNRSAMARQNMSVVAEKVAGLLEFKEDSKGIGTEVRVIAKAQNQAQNLIKGGLDKLDSRGRMMRALFGTDLKAVKNLNQQMEQNQLRIQQLEELKNQVVNQADETQIEEAIQAMIDQNTALADQIKIEEQTKGMFGWLVRLFVK
jgi:hypothetical protein